jgi:microbial collagenase
MRSISRAALCIALAAALATPAQASPKPYKTPHQAKIQARQPAAPRLWQHRPPTDFQARYRLQDNRTVIGRPLKKLIRHAATPPRRSART